MAELKLNLLSNCKGKERTTLGWRGWGGGASTAQGLADGTGKLMQTINDLKSLKGVGVGG